MALPTLRLPPAIKSLSARLLLLTILFVMLIEFLIYAPSVARFRKDYLEDAISDAYLAILFLAAAPEQMVEESLAMHVLEIAEARQIVIREPGEPRRILLMSGAETPDLTVDLQKQTFFSYLEGAFDTLFRREDRLLRVIGDAPTDNPLEVEILIEETPMRRAMYNYSVRIFELSLIISVFTAALVYIALQLLMVAPLRRITESIVLFSRSPEDVRTTVKQSQRGDEIGVTENVLADMQRTVRDALREKARLAALGAAVAKINHDLRNILSPAHMLSDRLVDSDDPEVKRIAPRLLSALDRAVDLSVQTLNFAREEGPPLTKTWFGLRDLVDEVAASVHEGLDDGPVALRNEAGTDIEIKADRDQLFRVLVNLVRNAIEAGASRITISAQRESGAVLIDIRDNGPGLAKAARDHIFQPFAGSARPGGTGLGLAISNELVRAHDGTIELLQTGPEGTIFRIVLPDS